MRFGSKVVLTSTLAAGLAAFGAQKQSPSSDPTRNNPDVPHQEPGTDNPDVGKQRHAEPGATTSTDPGANSGQSGNQQSSKRKGHHKKSSGTSSQTSTTS